MKAASDFGGLRLLGDCDVLLRCHTGVGAVVMLVFIDLSGLAILLTSQSVAVLRGEVAVVGGAHAALLFVDGDLMVLKISGLARRELAALDTLRDAVLLIFFACRDVVALRSSGLGKARYRYSEQSNSKGHIAEFHDVLSISLT